MAMTRPRDNVRRFGGRSACFDGEMRCGREVVQSGWSQRINNLIDFRMEIWWYRLGRQRARSRAGNPFEYGVWGVLGTIGARHSNGIAVIVVLCLPMAHES